MIKQVNTTLKLSDGEKVNCALNMASLFKLEHARPEIYEQTSQGMNGITKDKTHAAVDVLYGSYLCGNIDNIDSCMNKSEFIEKLPGYSDMMTVVGELLAGKKSKI